MFMQGEGYGVVSHMRVCLASAFYGQTLDPSSGKNVARVDSACDPNEFLDGQSKLQTPYLMCIAGDTNNKSQTSSGQFSQTEIIERLEVYAVLDAKPDAIGRAPMD